MKLQQLTATKKPEFRYKANTGSTYRDLLAKTYGRLEAAKMLKRKTTTVIFTNADLAKIRKWKPREDNLEGSWTRYRRSDTI